MGKIEIQTIKIICKAPKELHKTQQKISLPNFLKRSKNNIKKKHKTNNSL